MKINSIINKYIFKEFLSPFFINLLFLTFVFLMTQILEITELMVNYKISLFSVVCLLVYSVPFFLEFTIPMSVMLTILLTFMSMSSDNEIVAMKASGISIYSLLPPVILFCFLGCFLTGTMAIYGVPWGKSSFKNLVIDVAASNVSAGLKERVFNDSFENVMLYAHRFDIQQQIFEDVFIEDRRNEKAVSTVIAPRGKLIGDPKNYSFVLRLYDGDINQVNLGEKSVQDLHFKTYDVNLDIKRIVKGKKTAKGKYEMSLSELKKYVETHDENDPDYYEFVTKYYEKFSLPVACLVLGLIAMPLGLQSSRKASGMTLGTIFFIVYYLLLAGGWSMCKSGSYPPLIGMWMPNFVVGIAGIWLFVQTANERSFNIFSFWGKGLSKTDGAEQ